MESQNSKFKNKVAFKTTSNKLAVPLQLLKEAYKNKISFITPFMSFNSLGSDALLKPSVKRIHHSFQYNKAIPPILEGKDVLASAQTGTGKQPVSLPILQILSQGKHLSHRPIRALILTPTRELAANISKHQGIQ
jgi:superfamily II DNA/RNA helicase